MPQLDEVKDVVIEAPQGDTSATEGSSVGSGDTAVQETSGASVDAAGAESPAWTPDYKYKVADQEKELEEWVRPFVSDADKEKKFKDLYTRVDAFEFQKTKREKAEQTAAQIDAEHKKLANWVQGMISLRDGNDYDEFFSKVRLDEKKVMQWMLNKLETQEKLKDLPPHLQQAYNERQEYKRRAVEAEESNQQLQNDFRQQSIRQTENELGQTLSSPEVSALVASYDERAGAPGAFRRLVIRHGDAEFRESAGEKNLTPQQAVNEVLSILGLKQATQGASQASKPNGSATTTPKVVPQPDKSAALPNVGGGGNSSTTGFKKPKSIDDIRAMSRAMSDAG